MEWLQNPIVAGLIGIVGVPAAIYAWNLLLPRKTVYRFFNKAGKALRIFSFEKVGEKQAVKFLDVICNTLTDIFEGLADGTKGINKYLINEA